MRFTSSSMSQPSPVLTQKTVTDFSVVTGTLALLITYLLCKDTDVAWWGILTGCLLFCQLLQFCCYHTGAITFALGRSIFCIFVHPGWAHTLCTWTTMAQTYQTNIWICLVRGMSDCLSLLITEIQKQVWYFLHILGRIQLSILHGYCLYELLSIPNPYSLYRNVSNGTQFQRILTAVTQVKIIMFFLKN